MGVVAGDIYSPIIVDGAVRMSGLWGLADKWVLGWDHILVVETKHIRDEYRADETTTSFSLHPSSHLSYPCIAVADRSN